MAEKNSKKDLAGVVESSQSDTEAASCQAGSDARYVVEVKAEKQSIPDGLKKVLELLNKNLR